MVRMHSSNRYLLIVIRVGVGVNQVSERTQDLASTIISVEQKRQGAIIRRLATGRVEGDYEALPKISMLTP
jgi:hypothetical protein